jgi:hypothetical protein
MTRVLPALLIMTVLAGCGNAALREVATNNGGTLDCRSGTIQYAIYEYAEDAAGAPTAEQAVANFSMDDLPTGEPIAETTSGDSATLVFTDQSGNRIGRAHTIHFTNGWIVDWTEHCG